MADARFSWARGAAAQAPPAAPTFANPAGYHINPATGLATDYLNHFHEGIMLLEMAPSSPAIAADFLAWRPLSYAAHFAASRFADRDVAIAAYNNADPLVRRALDALANDMTAILTKAQTALRSNPAQPTVDDVVQQALANLKPLVAHAGAVINGTAGANAHVTAPQQMVDALMER